MSSKAFSETLWPGSWGCCGQFEKETFGRLPLPIFQAEISKKSKTSSHFLRLGPNDRYADTDRFFPANRALHSRIMEAIIGCFSLDGWRDELRREPRILLGEDVSQALRALIEL